MNPQESPRPGAILRPMSTTPAPFDIQADLALRARCLARPADRRAWDDLYRRYAPLARARLSYGRRVFPAHEVEDALQTVFLKLATGALERFEGRASLKAYVLTLADSVRISENRRRMAAKRGSGRTLSLDDPRPHADCGAAGTLDASEPLNGGTPADPESLFFERRRTERVRAAIARLSDPRDREIVALYFAEEPKVDREIAERLRMPLNTVTWRRLKAMKELRRHLHALEGRPL